MATSSTCTFSSTRDEQLSARPEKPDGSIADRCPVHRTLEGQIEIHTHAGEA